MKQMYNVLILCHRRGWNKLTNFILGLKKLDYRVTVVSDEWLGKDYEQFGLDKADEVCINKDFNIKEVLLHTPTADIIYSVNENLLPIQAQLEKHYGLNNVSEHAAEILSHKDKLDTYCRSIGLGEYVPDSIVPVTPPDLDMFDPINQLMTSDKGCVPHDLISEKSDLNLLYNSNTFKDFLKYVLELDQIFPYVDNLSSINLNFSSIV